ncbi:hypothetical protein [Hymenobacter negativus]|uniref:PH domain-containing protein n=1 Tax=Hymenobacter negativus TaxID=2795026 RepID=A0ABS3QAB2_9BACT|nr:hypothetical protein [Hymenobacter negativus]MBO2008188.1 hypothetical protein [Hymenobacter negativus]
MHTTETATEAAEGPTILYHRRHARQQVAKAIGHVGPAVLFLLGVMPILLGEEHISLMSGLEIAIGALYLVLMVRELRHLRHNPFHRERVAWLELAAAAILAMESYHIWHRHHEAELAGAPHRLHTLPWLYAVLAVVYVVLAFRMHKLGSRRFLHLHSEGFAVRTKHLAPVQELRWADIATVAPDGPAGVLVCQPNGREYRISFASVHDGAAHRDRLLAHVRQQGVPDSSAEEVL